MPVYLTSLSEMVTMPVAVNTEEYIDVWCNTATDTAWKIRFAITCGRECQLLAVHVHTLQSNSRRCPPTVAYLEFFGSGSAYELVPVGHGEAVVAAVECAMRERRRVVEAAMVRAEEAGRKAAEDRAARASPSLSPEHGVTNVTKIALHQDRIESHAEDVNADVLSDGRQTKPCLAKGQCQESGGPGRSRWSFSHLINVMSGRWPGTGDKVNSEQTPAHDMHLEQTHILSHEHKRGGDSRKENQRTGQFHVDDRRGRTGHCSLNKKTQQIQTKSANQSCSRSRIACGSPCRSTTRSDMAKCISPCIRCKQCDTWIRQDNVTAHGSVCCNVLSPVHSRVEERVQVTREGPSADAAAPILVTKQEQMDGISIASIRSYGTDADSTATSTVVSSSTNERLQQTQASETQPAQPQSIPLPACMIRSTAEIADDAQILEDSKVSVAEMDILSHSHSDPDTGIADYESETNITCTSQEVEVVVWGQLSQGSQSEDSCTHSTQDRQRAHSPRCETMFTPETAAPAQNDKSMPLSYENGRKDCPTHSQPTSRAAAATLDSAVVDEPHWLQASARLYERILVAGQGAANMIKDKSGRAEINSEIDTGAKLRDTKSKVALVRSCCSSAESESGNPSPEVNVKVINVNNTPAGAAVAGFTDRIHVDPALQCRSSANAPGKAPAAVSAATATVGGMSVAAAVSRIRTVWESGVEWVGGCSSRDGREGQKDSQHGCRGVEDKDSRAAGLGHPDPLQNRKVIILDESELKSDSEEHTVLKYEHQDYYEDDQNVNGLDDRSTVELLKGVRVRRRIACACAKFAMLLNPVSLNVGASGTFSGGLHLQMDTLLLCAHRMSDVAVAMVLQDSDSMLQFRRQFVCMLRKWGLECVGKNVVCDLDCLGYDFSGNVEASADRVALQVGVGAVMCVRQIEASANAQAKEAAIGVGSTSRAFSRPCALFAPVYRQLTAVLASLMIFCQVDCLRALCDFLQNNVTPRMDPNESVALAEVIDAWQRFATEANKPLQL